MDREISKGAIGGFDTDLAVDENAEERLMASKNSQIALNFRLIRQIKKN